MERRENSRIAVNLSCRIAPQGVAPDADACVENISRGGILLRLSISPGEPYPSPGDLLAVQIDLPENRVFGKKCIHCQTTVTRVEAGPESALVAVRIDQIDFRTRRAGAAARAGMRSAQVM